jgi:phosphonate transport system substrate-binding protein
MRREKMLGYLGSLLVLVSVTAATEAAAEGEELRFSITAAVASDPSYDNYRALTKYVAERVGKSPFFVSGLSYQQVDNLFVARDVDVGFLCNTHFARRRDAVKFEAIAAPVIAGSSKPKFRLFFIVAKDAARSSLGQLRGASVDLADPLSTTTVYAAYLLRDMHETLSSFFGKTIYSGSHDMTIQLVANKVVDVGVIDGHIWDYHERVQPAFSSRTKIIFRSPEYTTPPVVVRQGLDPALKNRLREILVTMHEDTAGRALLQRLRIDRFVVVADKDYDDVLEIYDMVRDQL